MPTCVASDASPAPKNWVTAARPLGVQTEVVAVGRACAAVEVWCAESPQALTLAIVNTIASVATTLLRGPTGTHTE